MSRKTVALALYGAVVTALAVEALRELLAEHRARQTEVEALVACCDDWRDSYEVAVSERDLYYGELGELEIANTSLLNDLRRKQDEFVKALDIASQANDAAETLARQRDEVAADRDYWWQSSLALQEVVEDKSLTIDGYIEHTALLSGYVDTAEKSLDRIFAVNASAAPAKELRQQIREEAARALTRHQDRWGSAKKESA